MNEPEVGQNGGLAPRRSPARGFWAAPQPTITPDARHVRLKRIEELEPFLLPVPTSLALQVRQAREQPIVDGLATRTAHLP